MEILANPYRGGAVPAAFLGEGDGPSIDLAPVRRLLALCPKAAETPLSPAPALAREAGIGALFLKDERARMGLGSFKALGAAYALARAAERAREAAGPSAPPWERALEGAVYVAASAGNHGLSLAAGAKLFGARAVIFLSETVPEAFAARLEAMGAEVRRAGADYAASMAAAQTVSDQEGWRLLPDSSWPGCSEPARQVMEGYLAMAAEATEAFAPESFAPESFAPESFASEGAEPAPTHIFLQAGVGGLAAAVAAQARLALGAAPTIIVVEPDYAPALIESLRAGRVVSADGPISSMGRLDCKEPSLLALAGLARDADAFATISEAQAARGVARLAQAGFATTPSGGAGAAALLAAAAAPEAAAALGLSSASRALCFLSEGPEA